MTIKQPKIDEIAHLHSGSRGQSLVDCKVSKMEPPTEIGIGNRRIEFAGNSGRPLQGRGSDGGLHHPAFAKAAIRLGLPNSESGCFKRCAVSLHQLIKAAGSIGKNVVVITQPEAVMLNHRSTGKGIGMVTFGADDLNDLLLEPVKRHCWFCG